MLVSTGMQEVLAAHGAITPNTIGEFPAGRIFARTIFDDKA
ncbi:hypothetical protein [Paraburkholderia sp. JHI869]